MKVVICGAGQVGYHLARYLCADGSDVVVVDQSPALTDAISDQLDAQAIVGHAAHPAVLEKAGAAQADMLIAVTQIDEVNMVACQVAHTLFNVPLKIARIRQQNYLDPAWAALFGGGLPIDVVISPEIEVAEAISRRLSVPGAFDVIPLGGGRINVIGARCGSSTPIINTPLRQLTALFPDLDITILAILRGERVIIPVPSDTALPGDEVYFAVAHAHRERAMSVFGHEALKASRAIIVGGGAVGTCLAQAIHDADGSRSIRIVESVRSRAHQLAETLPFADVLHGDGMDADILREAGASGADALVAVTDHDESNIITALLGRRMDVRRSVALINKIGYTPLISDLGLDIMVSPREITASTILRHVRRGKIRSVHSIRDGRAEVIEGTVLATSPLAGTCVRDAKLPKGVLIGAVLRGGAVIIPRPDTVLAENDSIALIAAAEAVKKVEQLLTVRMEYF